MSLFEPFVDWADLTACVPASTTAQELNARGAGHQAHWPLWLDPRQPLGELFTSARFTSRSFRFGSLGSNVLGTRWILPNGQKVDLGGRVVKNVAGFDLLRFLSGSQGRFGRPESLILRLRPLAPVQRVASVEGPWAQLQRFVSALRGSSWAHSLDAVDLRSSKVHVLFANEGSLVPLFEAAVKDWAAAADLQLSFSESLPPHDALPFARAQAPLSALLDIAQNWPSPVSGFLGQGLLHLGPAPEGDLKTLHDQLALDGGHVEHPSLPAKGDSPQARWEAGFLQKLAAL